MATKQQEEPIGINELAAKLGAEPPQATGAHSHPRLGRGIGSRYARPSMSDPAVKRIVAARKKAA